MSPEFFVLSMFLLAGVVLFIEWLRDWRDFPRISATRDRNTPVDLTHRYDGRPRPDVSDIDDVAAEVSCGGDIGGDGGGD